MKNLTKNIVKILTTFGRGEEFYFEYTRDFTTFGRGEEFYFEFTRDFKRCIPKKDNNNCEIKRCSELSKNDCNRFKIDLIIFKI